MSALSVFAPAKINLALHVIGQREDGYHLLDSLVAFAPVGDRLTLRPAEGFSMTVSGPEAQGVPTDHSNLVLKAAALFAAHTGMTGGVAFHLEKNLPAASGIGGGSSDAAAAIRGLLQMGFGDASSVQARVLGQLGAALTRLGADIPMCLSPEPQRAQGVGDDLTAATLPPLPCLLVNPRVGVATPAVFKALIQKDNPWITTPPQFADAQDCIAWLAVQRNDLQPPAIATAPVIATVLETLAALPGCRLTRMSGSGATCFALFATPAEARAAETALRASRPEWWCTEGTLGDQRAASAPRPAFNVAQISRG
ncbi:4-(cytidine 5'-diphospho)-2-C-methyl-D-erythritol kinase [Sinirhodobacter sp. WL0062]|uniref:4-diphosphocytidyl-2-C-methyl-D-erythritol kinase n=1 Tax=Rhodobacter flavimaris TaxID=2907145 RepID=A0ABS8YVS5_9RHOB|nr:4-(cytidine 5'-diphospho)-2-C-methyl-D-erythritol kinase [Sinirhodobacter sp. WL0062]MCE5973598.1 4-(cytidine 5'-diphospho)-2-C-methyl-D-erythritol kinase [Sinirhodobacter sp. WL0062]